MPELTPAQQALLDEAKAKEEAESDAPAKPEHEEKPAEQAPPAETPYQGKFKQFKTVSQLETSYSNSFTEAQRLNERIKTLEAEKAALASTSDEGDTQPGDDDKVKTLEATIGQLETRLTAQEEKQKSDDERQFNAWMETHPELKDNDPLVQDLLEELGFVAQKAAKRKEFLTMSDGLDRAWTRLAPVAANEDEGELAGAKKMAQKELAASAAPSSGARSDSKKTVLTDDQKKTAKAYGFTHDEYVEYLNKQ